MRKILIILFVSLSATLVHAQYINRDGTTLWVGRMGVGKQSVAQPDANAWLEIGDAGTTKSLILPRVSATASVASPKAGMFQFDQTDGKLHYHNGTTWLTVLDNTAILYTDVDARNAVSATAPLAYNNTTGVFSLAQATGSTNGYLSSGDWTLFNGKESALAAGLSTQYYRGDKTWQTLNTDAVPEGSNLYYTTARFDTRLATKTTDNLTEGITNLYFTNARARASISATSPILYNSTTGVLTFDGSGFAPASGSGNYIRNQTGVQTSSNFNIDGTGIAASILISASAISGSAAEKLKVSGNARIDNNLIVGSASNYTGGYALQVNGGAFIATGGTMTDGMIAFGTQTATINQIASFRNSLINGSRSLWLTANDFTFNTYTGSAYSSFGVINNSGQWGIGTSAFVGTEKLRVNGDAYLDGSIRLGNLATDPAAGSNGMTYYNTTTNKFRLYVNGAWVDLLSGTNAILNQTGSQTASFNITGTGTMAAGATIGGGGAGNTSINVGGSGVLSFLESTVATFNSGASSVAGGLITFERGTSVQGRYVLGFQNGNTSYTSQLGTVTGYAAGTLGFTTTGTQTLNTGASFGASFVFDVQAVASNPNAISLVYSASGSTIAVPVIFKKDGTTLITKLTQVQPTAITAAATTSIDLSTGNIFQINLAANITTLTITNATVGKYYFQFTQDATGSRTITWPANFKWAGGTAPVLTTTANKTDYIECLYNGTNFLATVQKNY